MGKLLFFTLIATFFGFAAACESQPESSTSQPPTEQHEASGDEETRITNDQEKINDLNGLGDNKDSQDCPPPRESEGMCAQVITWAMSESGHCCEYPTPCHVPDEMETFSSEQECLVAAK